MAQAGLVGGGGNRSISRPPGISNVADARLEPRMGGAVMASLDGGPFDRHAAAAAAAVAAVEAQASEEGEGGSRSSSRPPSAPSRAAKSAAEKRREWEAEAREAKSKRGPRDAR